MTTNSAIGHSACETAAAPAMSPAMKI